MRRAHAVVGSGLVLAGVGLAVALVWFALLTPTYVCDEGVAAPSGWIHLGLELMATALVFSVVFGAFRNQGSAALNRVLIGVALADAALAVALHMYLRAKYNHWNCP